MLSWLRSVALAVHDGGHLGAWLRANDLVDIISQRPDTELPGLPEDGDLVDDDVRKKVLQAVGRRMAQCFGADSVREIDTFRVERKETPDPAHARVLKEYCFEVEKPCAPTSPYAPGAKMGDRGTVTRQDRETAPSAAHSADEARAVAMGEAAFPYRPPMLPLCDSPMETATSPMSPIRSRIAPYAEQNTRSFHKVGEICDENTEVMEPLGGIGESVETSAMPIEAEEELV